MADEDSRHVCTHHIESNGMILLGDLVLDIYQQVPIARHVSPVVGLELIQCVVQEAFPWLAIPRGEETMI